MAPGLSVQLKITYWALENYEPLSSVLHRQLREMGKKAAKSTRKFAASGQLKKTIQQRRKHQDIKRKAERRKTASARKGKDRANAGGADEDEGDEDVKKAGEKFKGMSVDDFLGGGFLDGEDEDEDMVSAGESDDEDEDEDEGDAVSEDGSFASVDDLDDDDEGREHLLELSKLAEKDPEFYKYLQENDKDLLDFDPDAAEDVEDEDMEDAEPESVPALTKEILQKWQKSILEQRSLRALRKLLIAFRSAVHNNDDEPDQAWSIDSPTVYNKLITTALKYTPVVLAHHCPYKTLANGKYKGPTQTHKWKTLQKLIVSYFHNASHLLSQISDGQLLILALTETAKLLPYVTGNRKAVKVYLKTCLDLWSSGEDNVRIAAFLSVRHLASATDGSLVDLALKNTYLALVRACKSTSAHTLPSINLMKNSASELYTIDHASAYQHAFGYVRQLAILLRNSLKVKSKESYKQVYNWQYVHCIDFWTIVLARACDRQTEAGRGGESELRPLIYPLVQVALGAIKLIPNARSYPYHLHLARSLIHLTQHTHTYVPLAPTLVPILTHPLTHPPSSSSSSSKSHSTLRPLDFETNLRAPQQYLKTRVYAEGLVEETSFVLATYLAGVPVHSSVGFPELVVPITMALRRSIKLASKSSHSSKGKGKGKRGSGSGKEVATIKTLIERIEESARWVEEKRKGVSFAPGKMGEVHRFESDLAESSRTGEKTKGKKGGLGESPLWRYVSVLGKAREKRRRLVEMARDGEGEMLVESEVEEDGGEEDDDESDEDEE